MHWTLIVALVLSVSSLICILCPIFLKRKRLDYTHYIEVFKKSSPGPNTYNDYVRERKFLKHNLKETKKYGEQTIAIFKIKKH